MMLYFKLLLFMFCGVCNALSSLSGSGFLVIAPKYFLANSKERVCISVHNRVNTITPVKLILIDENSDNVITSIEDYVKGNTTCLMIYVPLTEKTECKLQVELPSYGESDVSYFSEQNVEIKRDPLVTVIATEKPIYRPGEVVRFRILRLTHKLKIYSNKLPRVWIESPDGITVEQWLNVKTNLGLTELEFALSEESIIGDWKIKVDHTNISDFIENKTFKVKEYVLPSFDVVIKQPKEILYDEDVVQFEICARYSYNAPVVGDGKLELSIMPKSVLFIEELPKIIYEFKLDPQSGCSILNATGTELFLTDPVVLPEHVKVTAVVTETSSKKSEKATAVVDVFDSAVKLQFHCSAYFKSGLPYKGKLRVLSPKGHPITAVDLPIQICMKEGSVYGSVTKQCWNYSTDYSSEVVFTLPPRPNSSDLITLKATSLNHPNKYYETQRWRSLMIQPRATQDLRPWFSPSKSYIDISTVSPVMCNTEHSLHVQYTVKNFSDSTPTFYYLVESRGDLLYIGSFTPDSEKELIGKVLVGFPPARAFILRLLVTHDMSPESRVIVYYIRNDGEIIAASTVLLVDKCFPNKVRVRWSEKEVQPGASISLNVRAQPSSLCALNVIDSLITKDNFNEFFFSNTIWEKLEYYKIPFLQERTSYCKLPNVLDTVNEEPPDFELRKRRRKRMYLLPPVFDYVDAITAFNDIGVVVLTDLLLETRPCPNNSDSSFDFGLLRSGVYMPLELVVSNIITDGKHRKNSLSSASKYNKNSIRSFFPEAWLWSIVKVNDDGEAIQEMDAPHSITSWDANVFCINEEIGFGMSDPTSFATFLPFFLKVNAPKSFIRTEILPVSIVIYNYLGYSLPVKISFRTSDGLENLSPDEISDCITELSPSSFNFTIKANKVGVTNITVTAEVLPAYDNCRPAVHQGISDTVIKSIKILAEGFKVVNSYSSLLCNHDTLTAPWNLSVPDIIIKNTAKAKVTVSPGLLGPALQGLGDFLEMPTGCGEQNMIRLAPNIHILRYLETVNIPNSEKLKEKAINNIKKGYQRQLLYRHPDGAYSAFGAKNSLQNEEPSIWLTAFVINSFGQAANVITIDNKMLQQTLKWIVSKQLENGCFPLIGQVYIKELKGGLEQTESTATLTAYIVASLYKSGLPIPASIALNAEFCLSAANTDSDIYSLALITYAFTILNSTSHKTQHNLLKLQQAAKYDQGLIWWEKPGGSLALNIEITGYAILSLLKVGGTDNLVKAQSAVRWISTNRNYKGGFISTQDTVIGLEAISAFAMAVPTSNVTSLLLTVFESDGLNDLDKHTFTISNDNHDLQQYHDIKNVPSTLLVRSAGEGCALVQATLKYNVDENIGGDGFELSVFTSSQSVFDECYFQNMEICVRYTLQDAISNMVIITVNFVTGYLPERDSLNQNNDIKRWEENEEENTLILYLEKVESTSKCFSFTLQRAYKVVNPAPAVVTVTDYYHPERSKSVNYTIACDDSMYQLDGPYKPSGNNLENFRNVDFELSVPDGVEGPEPSYSCPDSNRNCQLPERESPSPNISPLSTNTVS